VPHSFPAQEGAKYVPPYQRPLSPGRGDAGPTGDARAAVGGSRVFSNASSHSSLPAGSKLASHKARAEEAAHNPHVSVFAAHSLALLIARMRVAHFINSHRSQALVPTSTGL
jgi:hypothetical protein